VKNTKIRWSNATLNSMIGCEHVSEGCDHCYADALATKYAGKVGWPGSFEEGLWKPQKLDDLRKWARNARSIGPSRVFFNSLSDVFWERWTTEMIDACFDAMVSIPDHDYLVLTKRPRQAARYFLGGQGRDGIQADGWLARRGLSEVPDQIWLGTTIELDKYAFRADWLRRIPVLVRFISAEPLLGPLPSLNLDGLGWVITGGESGNGSRNFRPMDPAWASELVDRCAAAGVAHFFKQDSGVRTEMRMDLLGRLIEEYPLAHPTLHGGHRVLGIHHNETPVTIGPDQGSLL